MKMLEILEVTYIIVRHQLPSLKLTFSLLKKDVWNFLLSYWVLVYFQGRTWRTVSFREGTSFGPGRNTCIFQ